MSTRVWYENGSIQMDGVPTGIAAQTLRAVIDGDRVHVFALTGERLLQPDYTEYARQDGTGFSSATAVKTYLDGEFAKAPTATATWDTVTGKPATFPPSAHTHPWGEVTGKPTVFPPAAHTHAIADVTGLQAALDGKLSLIPLSAPTARTVALGTAYQASTPTKAAFVTINLTSTASLSLTGGGTNTADIVIGSTNAVAVGTGTAIGKYGNSNTGTLTVGLALNTIDAKPLTFALPAGWWFAVRQTAGTVTITSAFDQVVG